MRRRAGPLLLPAVVVLLVATTLAVAAGRSAATSESWRHSALEREAAGAAAPLLWRAHTLGPSSLSAVACATPEDCFAVGLGGSLLDSTDGGRDWTATSLSLTRGLVVKATTCPTSTDCVALADRWAGVPIRGEPPGVALVSHDRGRSWHAAPVRGPPVSFLGGLSCPVRTICDATAAPVGSVQPSGFVLVSLDGGSSWTLRRPGPVGGLGGALSCSTVHACVATGGSGAVTTTDGGRHWAEARLPLGGGGRPAIAALACSSVTRCVAAGTEPHPGTPVLLESDNGGAVWRFVPAPAVTTARSGIDAGGGYTALSCEGPRCVAVADTLPQIGLVAESGDGGRTWRVRGLGAGGAFAAVTCGAAAGCLVAGTTRNGAATLAVDASDGTWSEPYVGTGTEWSALSCPTSLDCVAAGTSGPVPVSAAVIVSHDGGTNWVSGHLPAQLTGITALSCPTTSDCVALADVAPNRTLVQDGNLAVTAVLVSSDGGGTWTRRALGGGALVLDALSCPTRRDCVAVGAVPQRPGAVPVDAIVSTDDGGAHWHRAAMTPYPPKPVAGTSGSEIVGGGLSSVTCFSARSCLAGGAAGVLSTTDGTHWSVVERTPGPGRGGVVSGGILFGELELLACVTRDRCVGAFSTPTGTSLRASTDGGRQWRQGARAPVTFDVLMCPSTSECLAAGSGRHGALVLESFDGGRTFNAAPLPALSVAPGLAGPEPAYSTLACAGPATCLVLGTGATGEVAVATSDGAMRG